MTELYVSEVIIIFPNTTGQDSNEQYKVEQSQSWDPELYSGSWGGGDVRTRMSDLDWDHFGTESTPKKSKMRVLSMLLKHPGVLGVGVQSSPSQNAFAVMWVGFLGQIYTSLVAQMVKQLAAMQETQVCSFGQEDPLEKEMATHSRTLTWKIPWKEDPGRPQFRGSQRVGHDWETSLFTFLLKEKTTVTLHHGLRWRESGTAPAWGRAVWSVWGWSSHLPTLSVSVSGAGDASASFLCPGIFSGGALSMNSWPVVHPVRGVKSETPPVAILVMSLLSSFWLYHWAQYPEHQLLALCPLSSSNSSFPIILSFTRLYQPTPEVTLRQSLHQSLHLLQGLRLSKHKLIFPV